MRGNRQGSPLKDKEGNVVGWRVRVTLTGDNGKKVTKGFDRKTLKAAKDAADAFLGKNGRVVAEPVCGTVKEAWVAVEADLWAPGQIEDHTRKTYSGCARKLSEAFDGIVMDAITPPMLTGYYKRYASGSKRMMDEHWRVGRTIFGYVASDLGWLETSPMESARKPKATGDGREGPILTREEFDLILPHLEEPHNLFYRLMAETGARPSEGWTLDTDDRLEFLRDVWWFVVEKGKTEASTRRVPIPDSLARDLQAAGPRPFASIAESKNPATHLLWFWKRAMKAAGIPYTRPYEVRAMRINEWRRMEVTGKIRTKMVGHTSEKTTDDWYHFIDPAEILKVLGVGSGVGEDAADGEKQPS